MNKKIQKIIGVCLGLAMTAGVGWSAMNHWNVSPTKAETLTTTYDFVANFATYAATGWSNSYATHEGIDGKTDLGGSYAATIDLYKASKQTTTITDRPVFGTKTATGSYTQVLKFSLNETGYKIKEITATFAQWGSKAPSVALYKGGTVSGTALDTAKIGTKNTLTTSNLNDTVFSIGYCDGNTKSNVQSGLTSITISLEEAASFGTLDHISVTSLPNTIYHVGETYSNTGLIVTAYDGADENTANFKDVTALVETTLDTPTAFVDGDVPGVDCAITYKGDGGTDTTSFHIDVYPLAHYKLVTENLTDWSGTYLIVGTDDTDLFAMNGSLSILDNPENYEIVTANSENVIETGRELEWTVAKYSTGYSIQAKNGQYIGSLTDANNGLLTSETEVLNTISFNTGDVTIVGTNGRGLKLNTNSPYRFRYYTGGTVKLYKLVESDKANAFAQTFLNALVCDATGVNAPSFAIKEGTTYWSWDLLASEYNTLSASEKEQFRLGVASESGNDISKALARYDYIVGKYGTALFADFMNREPTSLSNYAVRNSVNQNAMLTVVVISSSVALLGVCAYLFLRKKKEQ